jgi:Protein of unknown function with HXXEE motif
MTEQGNAAQNSGPFGLYDRWPYVHVAIGVIVVAGAAITWPLAATHPRWLWFLVLTLPVLIVHQFEESAFPGGFLRWFNLYIWLSPDPERPLSKKQLAMNHMPLMLLYPAAALAGTRWPWFGLAGIYALVADALFHLSGTGITRRYSPGVVTGVLLYIPLGTFATWYLVAGGDVSPAGLLAAALLGSISLNFFQFAPIARSIGFRPRSLADGLAGSSQGAVLEPGLEAGSMGGSPAATTDPGETDILPFTRRLAAVIIPILALAFIILYLFPDTNGAHFAYDVQPRMSAMFLGATYLTGVVYFSTILWARFWHQVRLGLLPVALFATILAITTVLQWSDFNRAAPEFWLWNVLYFGIPIILPLAWFRNERHARRSLPAADDFRLGRPTRTILGAIGVLVALTSLLLFLAPDRVARVWPWPLTPLNARITAAEFGLFGLFGLLLAVEARWSQVRDLIRPQLLTPLFFLGAIIASWSDFDRDNPLTFVFIAFVVLAFVIGFPALYFPGEAKQRRQNREANVQGTIS